MTRTSRIGLGWLASAAILVSGASADQTIVGDITVMGTVRAREVRVSDGSLVSDKKLDAFKREIISQAVSETLNALRLRSTTSEVRTITDEIASNVMEMVDKKLRDEASSGTKRESSEITALKRQISDLESKQRDAERQISKLERDIEQLRRHVAQGMK